MINFQNKAIIESLELQRQQGKYEECIKSGMSVSRYSVMYGEVWKLIEQCSQGLLEQSMKKFQDEYDLNEAKRLLSLIPRDSYFRNKAENKAKDWTDEFYYRRMEDAYKKCSWLDVTREASKLTTEHWIKKSQLLIKEAKNPDTGSLNCPNSSNLPPLVPGLKN